MPYGSGWQKFCANCMSKGIAKGSSYPGRFETEDLKYWCQVWRAVLIINYLLPLPYFEDRFWVVALRASALCGVTLIVIPIIARERKRVIAIGAGGLVILAIDCLVGGIGVIELIGTISFTLVLATARFRLYNEETYNEEETKIVRLTGSRAGVVSHSGVNHRVANLPPLEVSYKNRVPYEGISHPYLHSVRYLRIRFSHFISPFHN